MNAAKLTRVKRERGKPLDLQAQASP